MSETLKPKEKLAIMNEEYEIPIEQNIRKEVDNMYTLSQHIEEQAKTEEKVRIIMKMYQKKYPLEEIAELVGKTIEEVRTVVESKSPLLS